MVQCCSQVSGHSGALLSSHCSEKSRASLAKVSPSGNPVCHTHKQLLSRNEPDLGGYLKFQMSGQRKSISSQPVHNTEFNRNCYLWGIACRWGGFNSFFSKMCRMQLLFSCAIFHMYPSEKPQGF